ncbi:MAG TPA: response regulator [Thermoanaerobaculia bacterium]|nr:response regulator [Thermoanaerobaculia bacterium]
MLIVEDESTVLFALRKYFTAAGYRVDYARELEEAEALIATTQYHIVIADLRLSGSSAAEGLEVLRFVRQQSRGTKVVILTAYGSPEIQGSARMLGASAFLQKPAPLPEIGATVLRLLEEA